MFVAAIKCDFCQKAHDLTVETANKKPEVPEGWAMITPMIRIKGTPNITEWEEANSDLKRANQEKRKLYDKRRNMLRDKFEKYHVCLDCIEQIHTGRISLKIGL